MKASVAGWTNDFDYDIGLAAPPTGNNQYGSAAIKMAIMNEDGEQEYEQPTLYLETYGSEQGYLYQPAQLHFHTPSEHSVEGKLYDAEMHIVHVAFDGTYNNKTYNTATALGDKKYAVYGIFFEELDCEESDSECLASRAASDKFFEGLAVFDEAIYVPSNMSFDRETEDPNTKDFLASLVGGQFYSYDGSFTTPPCTEGVKWTVLRVPAPISPWNLASM